MDEIILLKEGEMVLKGLNKRAFERRLISNVRKKLLPFGDFRVYCAQSTIYAEPRGTGFDIDAVTESLRRVFGIVSVTRAVACGKTKEEIASAAKTYLAESLAAAHTFKVESKRSDKSFPMTSIELSRYVGTELNNAFPHLKAEMRNPGLTVRLEVRDYAAYVHCGAAPGAGGLPVGTCGRAVSLLSGGIDSPLSTWMIARRGVEIVPLHFFSFPYTSELAKQKVIKLATILEPWCGRLTLQIIPFTEIQEEIHRSCPEEFFTLVMRRFMMRIADRIAEAYGCGAIVTGENLSQVASQTIEAIACTDACVSRPILRPLIGMDKLDIIAGARRIGTFDTSIEPYEDCCTVFTPRHPKTKPRPDELEAVEKVLDIDALVSRALSGIERVRIGNERE
ncbi:MAG: tRNA 4-thiouridine(8) synthase ThiI [Clostridiales bacterium]|nr:tRNA 4-thiouridine(8) synthase ThiI [Clostridiales bacterium]